MSAISHLVSGVSLVRSGAIGLPRAQPEEGSMLDLLYIGMTIVVFGVLWLLVKGVEHFEH